MPSVIEIDAARVPATEIEKVRGFAASLEDPQLRDVLLSLTLSVSSGQDVALFESDSEFSPNQVAKRLRMSRTHLYALLDSGEIPFHRVGRDRHPAGVEVPSERATSRVPPALHPGHSREISRYSLTRLSHTRIPQDRDRDLDLPPPPTTRRTWSICPLE